MRIIKAAFSKTFPISQYYEKVYLEAELNEGDDERQVLYDLKKKVENFFYESTKAAEKFMGTHVVDVYKNAGLNEEEISAREQPNMEWQQIKDNLSKLEFKEDAQEYINTTNYRMTIEAKQIINSKPSKHESK